MRLILITIPILILSSCSFFESSVQTCEEIQEYQSSVSIPQLLLPQALLEIQKRSSFDMSDLSGSNPISREEYLPLLEELPETSPIKNISGDDLSELLDLIDDTIEGRNNITTQNQIISKVSQNVDSVVKSSVWKNLQITSLMACLPEKICLKKKWMKTTNLGGKESETEDLKEKPVDQTDITS